MVTRPADDLDPRVKALIRRKVKSIIGNYGFHEDDKRDLRQQLSQHVAIALPKHDPARASLATFANAVINNAAASIVTHATAQKRDRRRERQPEESQAPSHDGAEARAKLDLRLDMLEALKDLNAQERQVAELFMDDYREAGVMDRTGLTREKVRGIQRKLAKLLKERGLA